MSAAILVSGVLLVGAVVLVSGPDSSPGSSPRRETPRPIQPEYFTQIREAEQRLIQHYAGLWASVGNTGELEFREQVLDAEQALRREAERLDRNGSPNSDLDKAHAAFTGALRTFADALFLVRDRELSEGSPAAKLSDAALISDLDAAFALLSDAGFEVDPLAWIVARGEPLGRPGSTEPGRPTGSELPPQLTTR